MSNEPVIHHAPTERANALVQETALAAEMFEALAEVRQDQTHDDVIVPI
jgi:hypothetical protein